MKTGQKVRFSTTLPAAGRYQVRISHNYISSRTSSLPVNIHHAEGSTTATIDQRKAPEPDGVFADLGTYEFTKDQPAVVAINVDESADGHVIIDAVQFLPQPSAVAVPDAKDQELMAKQKAIQDQIKQIEQQLKTHQAKKPQVSIAMCVEDQPEPADWHLHIRGNPRNLGPLVPRGFVSVLSPAADPTGQAVAVEIPKNSSGRLQLAEWMASSDNPLTARVFVNRVWQHLIGEGIVRTPDNFGATGQQPTHPELLDHLAHNFMHRDKWSVKSLIRRIATSRAYRMSSTATTDHEVKDPENQLLSRAVRKRLDAEVIRDSILTISGQMNPNVRGGQTINKVTQYDNGYDHDQYSAITAKRLCSILQKLDAGNLRGL